MSGTYLLSYLERVRSTSTDVDSDTSSELIDAKSIALRHQEQTNAMRTLIEFLIGEPNIDSSSTNATAANVTDRIASLFLSVWSHTRSQLSSLFRRDAEFAASQSAAIRVDNEDQTTNRREKKVSSKKRGGGGKTTEEQTEILVHKRQMIQEERRIWIELECIRLIASILSHTGDLPNTMLTEIQSAVGDISQLMQSQYVHSHNTAVPILVALSSLSNNLQRQICNWCLDSLTRDLATGSSSPSVSDPTSHVLLTATPDIRPLCSLIALLQREIRENQLRIEFDSRIWAAILQVIQKSPSASLRQTSIRQLLPHALKLDNGVGDRDRLSSLFHVIRNQWMSAVNEVVSSRRNLSNGSARTSDDLGVISSPLLEPTFLTQLITQQSQLDMVPDLLCSHVAHFLPALDNSDRVKMDELVLDVAMSGLSSSIPLYKKQCIYLLQTRLMLQSTVGDEMPRRHVDYTPDEWSTFINLYHLLEGSSLHLLESSFPRIRILLDAPIGMGSWLELLLWRAFAHPHPSIAAAAFHQLYTINQADSDRPSRLSASMVIGPCLTLFDTPMLFSTDKQRRGTHRLGDQLLVPFIVDYVKRLPDQHDGDASDQLTKHQFLRYLLFSMTHSREYSSIISLCGQLSALAQVPSTHCLTQVDVDMLLQLMTRRVMEASYRLRMELIIYALQVFAMHTNFSSDLPFTFVGRLLLEFPSEWMRLECSSYQLLQLALNRPSTSTKDGWLAAVLPSAIDQIFDQLASAENPNSNSTDFNLLIRVLMFVVPDSSLERQVLSQLQTRLERHLFPNGGNENASLIRLNHILEFACQFSSTFAKSRELGLEARRSSETPQLESIRIPTSASSERCLREFQSTTVSSASVSSVSSATQLPSWQTRLTWAESQLIFASLPAIRAIEDSQYANIETSSNFILTNLTLAFSHSCFASCKQQLMLHLTSRMSTIGMSHSPAIGTDRSFLVGALFAVITNISAEDFQSTQADSSIDPQSDLKDAGAWSTGSGSVFGPPPRSVARFLARSLMKLEIGRKPSSVSNSDWHKQLQLFHSQRWQMIRRLLEVDCRVESDFLTVCLESLDGASEYFLEPILHALRTLMPRYINEHQTKGTFTIDMIESIYRAAWIAFRDLHVELPSYTAVLAFLSVIFESSAFSIEANHGENGPFSRYLHLLIAYSDRHTRLLAYIAFFATAAWSRYPHLLQSYTSDLVNMCIYVADQALEIDIIEEKLRAYTLAHLIHNFSECSKVAAKETETEERPILATNQLRRAESLVRCVSLRFLQHLPQLITSLPPNSSDRSTMELTVVKLAESIISHSDMQNDKGMMSGEGNEDFVRKCHLWQSFCLLLPSLEVAGTHREQLHELLQHHAWTWFERPMNSVLRHYVEIFLSHLYALQPSRIDVEVGPRLSVNQTRPTLLASVLLILAQSTIHIRDTILRARQARDTIRLLHPFAACNFGHVRLMVQYYYHRIVRDLAPPEWSSLSVDRIGSSTVASSSDLDIGCIQSLYRYLSSDVDMDRLRLRQDAYFLQFNPIAYSTVEGILANGDEHHHFLSTPILELSTKLQGEFLSGLRSAYDDRRFGVNGTETTKDGPIEILPSVDSLTMNESSQLTNFQQKIDVTPLAELQSIGDLTTSNESDSIDGVSLRDAVEHRTSSDDRQSVIVIASLVGKTPNLAGLSRTCEIFKAESLMVADIGIIHDKEFQNVSVTAQKWMPIHELKPNQIRTFMKQKQQEGYTCIALEQSAKSIRLTEYQFPSRIVILLGAEKEGVPVELLNLVDHCVEIPQLGILRSLNVHVSGSILLWEFTRQQLLGITAPD